MRKRHWAAAIGLVVVAALGAGVWLLSRPPSLPWSTEEIAAQQRAHLEASMPPGEAAWPLIKQAMERTNTIAARWPAPMTGQATMVLDSLRTLPWDDPRLASAKAAAAELAPVVDLFLQASQRPRLFTDGAEAQEAGAWMDGENMMPAGSARFGLLPLRIDGRRALAEGDYATFASRLQAQAALTQTIAQSPLLISMMIINSSHWESLDEIVYAVRAQAMPSEACEAARLVAEQIAIDARGSAAATWESERLWVYAESIRMLDEIHKMGGFARLKMRARVMYGGVDSLDPLEEQFTWGWMDWFAAHSPAEMRRRIDEQYAAITRWWDEPFESRRPSPPDILEFPDVGLMAGNSVEAIMRGRQHLLEARAVGVIALLEIEAHHARTGQWPVTLDEVTGAANLRCPVTGNALEYTPAPPVEGSVWPFTLRLPIDDETMERIDPAMRGAMSWVSSIERPDRRLITREPQALDDADLRSYEWLVAPAGN